MAGGRKRLLRVIKWVVGILALIIVVLLYGVIPWFLSNFVTTNNFRFRDPNARRTPASLGLTFRDTAFESSDHIPLKGWYIPASLPSGDEAHGTIIYCHGLHRSRVEMLPMAEFGHSLGYDGLLFDFRNHGQSGGTVTSIGYWERLDVEAAVRDALTRENAPRPVIVWGVSMGAAAALMAAAEDPQINAVISDSTFLSFDRVIQHHYHLIVHLLRRHWWWFPPLPSFPITNEIIAWSAWRAHFRPSAFNLETAVQRIAPRPILFVAVKDDVRMPPQIARTLYSLDDASIKALVVVPGRRHGEGFNESRPPYEAAVAAFLSRIPKSNQPKDDGRITAKKSGALRATR
jgi:pimeloyl-ACP methyl ester carboxylesterase